MLVVESLGQKVYIELWKPSGRNWERRIMGHRIMIKEIRQLTSGEVDHGLTGGSHTRRAVRSFPATLFRNGQFP